MALRALEKRLAGDARHARSVEQVHRALLAGRPGESGHICQDIVGPLGDRRWESDLSQGAAKPIPLGFILTGQSCVERPIQLLNAHGHSMLERSRGAHVQQIIHRADQLRPAGLSHAVADPPAGNAEGLGIARHGNRALHHPREGGEAQVRTAVVEEVLVDFVGEHEEVVAQGEIRNPLQLRPAIDLPGGIARRVDHDGLCPAGNRALQVGRREGPVRSLHADHPRDSFHRHQRADVVAVVGFEDDHFIAGSQQRQTGAMKRPRGPGTHGDLGLRVCGETVVVRKLSGDSLP